MTDFKAKMHQFRLGLRPRPLWGSLQRSPRPPSWIWGALLLRRGEERGGEGRKVRGGEGKGHEPPTIFGGSLRLCRQQPYSENYRKMYRVARVAWFRLEVRSLKQKCDDQHKSQCAAFNDVIPVHWNVPARVLQCIRYTVEMCCRLETAYVQSRTVSKARHIVQQRNL